MTNLKNQTIVQVKVVTKASRDLVKVVGDQKFEVSVREKPKQNMANLRIIELIASHFGVSVKAVRLVSGHYRKNKRISIIGTFN